MANGKLIALWQPAELVIILGAGLGSMIIGNSSVVLKECVRQLKAVMGGRKNDADRARQLLLLMHLLLEEVRKHGLKVLDEHIEAPHQSPWFQRFPLVLKEPILVNFVTDNMRLLAMGKNSAHEVEGLLDQEIHAIEADLMKPSKALHRTGEAMPGFGILAAVGGIIITMQYLDGPLADVGIHVAAALVGTFIGIFTCYCIMEPAAAALAEANHRLISLLEGVKAILVANLEGKVPLLAIDAGRRILELDIKPSFASMESWLSEQPSTDSASANTREAA